MIGNTKRPFGKRYEWGNCPNNHYVKHANWRGGLFWVITLITLSRGKQLARAGLLTTYSKHYAGVVILRKRGLNNGGFSDITPRTGQSITPRAIVPS